MGTHFPSCYKCSWENGPENAFPQKMYHAHMVNVARGSEARATRARAREPESPSAEPQAQSRDHKEKPTATHMVFVGTHFPSCYECSWENGPDNWIQLSGPFSQLHL